MAEPVPIRPDLPIQVTSDAMRFCADAVAEFITDSGDDPHGAVVVLIDGKSLPTISYTGVTPKDLCFIAAWLQRRAMQAVDDA